MAGTTHLPDPSVLEEIRVDDWLGLMREENKFDDNAIVLAAESGKKAGYVPEKDNVIFARLMDAGKLLRARVRKIERLLMDRDQLKKEAGQIRTRWRRT